MKIMWEIFEKLMQRENLSISAAARKCGCSPSTLTDWRAGRYTPKADKLKRFAEAFGVSIEYLMTGSETPSEPLSASERELLRVFRSLNAVGRSEALRRISEMAKLNEYIKEQSRGKVG